MIERFRFFSFIAADRDRVAFLSGNGQKFQYRWDPTQRSTVHWTVGFDLFDPVPNIKQKRHPDGCLFCLVPLTGIEPVRFLGRGILSPLCLPVPPQRRLNDIIAHYFVIVKSIKGETEISGRIFTSQGVIHGKRCIA